MSERLVVGGTFDANGGKQSRIVSMLAEALTASEVNGGTVEELQALDLSFYKVVIWMPNVSNDEEKLLPNIKEKYPKLLLVSSKNAIGRDFTESDMVGRLLKSKSNLGIMITKPYTYFQFSVLDPLGNLWARTDSVPQLAWELLRRIEFLQKLTRVRSVCLGPVRDFDVQPEFIEVVRELGSKFATFVNAINPNRLLGNASTRCASGFPAIRDAGRVLVTRRNVDKATLSASDFVEVTPAGEAVGYYGDAKPSVDTPMQLKLFAAYPSVRYMVHGHVYVKGAHKTAEKLPCGAVEEVGEVLKHYPSAAYNVALNLRGHGCLMLARDLDFLRSVELKGRPFPEE